MAKSGGSSMVTLLLLGGAGYLVYEWFFATSATAAATATPASPTPAASPAVSATATGATPTPASGATLDQMYQNMVNAATAAPMGSYAGQTSAGFSSGTPDNWCYYFSQGNNNKACPDPEQMGWDRATNWPTTLTAAAFWAQAAPYVKLMYGLSGLGILGGLGALVRQQRGW